MSRAKIPEEIQAEVIFKSNRECVVCDNHKKGDQIHHIDGNPSNNKFENLAFLCFDCHNDASITGSLKKKLIPKAIIKFRDHRYQVLAAQREKSLKVFNSSIKGLTTEDILTITKSAIIIIEIEKIREEYFSADWEHRAEIISKLNKYYEHSNFRVAVDVFNFLSIAADQTRSRMPDDVAIMIFSLIIDFFPYGDDQADKKKTIELASQCTNIAFSLVYDAAIYLKNFQIMMYGLLILKFIYKKGKEQHINKVIDKVNETYDEIESTLQRPERNDLKESLQLVREFKNDRELGTLTFPVLSDNLMKIIYPEK